MAAGLARPATAAATTTATTAATFIDWIDLAAPPDSLLQPIVKFAKVRGEITFLKGFFSGRVHSQC